MVPIVEMTSLEIRFKRVNKVYHEGENVTGVVVVNTKSTIKHEGIGLTVDGTVDLQLSSKSVGLFEAFYNTVKPIQLMNYCFEVARPGKLPVGKTEIPFEFPLKPKSNKTFFETYHGVFVNVQYTLKCDIKRSMLSKDLMKSTEFFFEYKSGEKAETKPVEFTITPNSLQNVDNFIELGAPPSRKFLPQVDYKFLSDWLSLSVNSQGQLLELLPKLHNDLIKGKIDTLQNYIVSIHGMPTPTLSNNLSTKIIEMMCATAASAVKLQCGREYGFSEVKLRATDLSLLSEKDLEGLPTNNLVAKRDFSREAQWDVLQHEKLKTRLEAKLNKSKKSEDYTKKLLQNCKSWRGPCTSLEELQQILKEKSDQNFQIKLNVPRFFISGRLDSTSCQISNPLTGQITVEKCDSPIKSIELQLVRVETCGCAEGYAKDATEIQNIQLGEGDVCRGIAIPIYMIFPRLFTCPTLVTSSFKVEFELNIVVVFEDDHLINENFAIKLTRF
ncbi:Down syndrome critical region protein 3 [Nymphon striatum]|nr:Down syndrome critical region protein 3 [Nymphon striatum]